MIILLKTTMMMFNYYILRFDRVVYDSTYIYKRNNMDTAKNGGSTVRIHNDFYLNIIATINLKTQFM